MWAQPQGCLDRLLGGACQWVKAEESVLVEPLGEEFLLFRQVRVFWIKWGAETLTNVWDQ